MPGGTDERGGPRRKSTRVRFLVTFVLLSGMIAVLLCGGGCEALVPGTVEAFHCGSSAPAACPPGQVCATTMGECVPASSACSVTGCTPPQVCDPGTEQCMSAGPMTDAQGTDTSRPGPDVVARDSFALPDTTPPVDVQVDPSCGGLAGCACAGPTDCKAGLLCADSSILPNLTSSGFFCTLPCCTSDDCPDGTVCYGSGAPGNYCVATRLLNRGATGGNPAGASCAANTDCRSGSCVSGHCLDPCCSDASCQAGSYCAFATTAVDGHQGFFCLAHSSAGAPGDFCTHDSDCNSEICAALTCFPICCGKASCSSPFNTCELYYAANNTDVIANCAAESGSGSAFGAACTDSSTCASVLCDPGAHTCTDVCCVDADCKVYGNYVCRPAQDISPRSLICVKGP